MLLLSRLILVRILNEVLEVVELIGTLRCRGDGLNACIVVVTARRSLISTLVYLKGFEFVFLLCSSLIRLIMLNFFEHDFVSLVLGIAVVVWSILIGTEMLINVPKCAVI